MDGFLLIDKDRGWTSRDVCNKVQAIFHTRKVGHIGTLDPFATGLLIVSVNKATKAGQFLDKLTKTYEAKLILGTKTSTGDLSGKIIETHSVPHIAKQSVLNVLESLKGELLQIPPMTSAKHFKGQRLYKFAHRGETVEREACKVFIYELSLISYSQYEINFRAKVSPGTYIRTLGEQIAEKLNTVGYLETLRRLKIGEKRVSQSKTIDKISEMDLIPISKGLNEMPSVVLDDETVSKAKSGVNLTFDEEIGHDTILLLDSASNAIAVYAKVQDKQYKCVRGLW